MNKFKIIIASVIVLIIVAVAAIVVVSNLGDEQKPITSISSDSFEGTIISKDSNKIIVIPNEDELMREMSFDIVDVMINNNTQLLNGEDIIAIESIEESMNVKVSFDGKIYETNPAKIVAEKIEIIVDNK